jgi:hypothetical protein
LKFYLMMSWKFEMFILLNWVCVFNSWYYQTRFTTSFFFGFNVVYFNFAKNKCPKLLFGVVCLRKNQQRFLLLLKQIHKLSCVLLQFIRWLIEQLSINYTNKDGGYVLMVQSTLILDQIIFLIDKVKNFGNVPPNL